jgi:HlyD family secretion protein
LRITLAGKYLWLALGILLLAGLLILRNWQGPELRGYQLVSAPLVQRVVAAGRVTNEQRVQISTELSGLVVELPGREGSRVATGELLAVIRAADLEAQQQQLQAELREVKERRRPQTEAELRVASSELKQAQRERQRREQLLQAQLIIPEVVEQARQLERSALSKVDNLQLALTALAPDGAQTQQLQARLAQIAAQLAKTRVTATASGLLLSRHVEAGDRVQPGTLLFTLASDSVVEVHTQLDERNLAQLALGQKAQVIADAYPEQLLSAEVSFISPVIDARRGTVEVRLRLFEPPAFLRQDMTVSVTIETASKASTLVVPNEALFSRDGDGDYVWAMNEGRVSAQKVRLGLRGLTHSEVLSGLTSGDKVLTEFDNKLSPGQRVRLLLPATKSAD